MTNQTDKAPGPVLDTRARTFRGEFCDRLSCPPLKYEREIFWRCLYRHAVPVACLICLVNRDFFREDFELIERMGQTASREEFHAHVDAFVFCLRFSSNFLRRHCRIRLSCERLVRFYDLVCRE